VPLVKKADLRTILMVEDDPDIGVLARIALEELGGWKLHLFTSGEPALQAIGEIGPDLIILDYRLPVLSGADILERLRAEHPGCDAPVLFLTASVMPQQIQRLKDLGAADVLAKPFDPVELPQLLSRFWQSHLQNGSD